MSKEREARIAELQQQHHAIALELQSLRKDQRIENLDKQLTEALKENKKLMKALENATAGPVPARRGRRKKTKNGTKGKSKNPDKRRQKRGKRKLVITAEKRARAINNIKDGYKRCLGICGGLILPEEDFNKGQQTCRDCQNVLGNVRNDFIKDGKIFHYPKTKGSKECDGCKRTLPYYLFDSNPKNNDGRADDCMKCAKKTQEASTT